MTHGVSSGLMTRGKNEHERYLPGKCFRWIIVVEKRIARPPLNCLGMGALTILSNSFVTLRALSSRSSSSCLLPFRP